MREKMSCSWRSLLHKHDFRYLCVMPLPKTQSPWFVNVTGFGHNLPCAIVAQSYVNFHETSLSEWIKAGALHWYRWPATRFAEYFEMTDWILPTSIKTEWSDNRNGFEFLENHQRHQPTRRVTIIHMEVDRFGGSRQCHAKPAFGLKIFQSQSQAQSQSYHRSHWSW
jgi:hypothetical protein